MARPKKGITALDRFRDKVIETDTCWLWTGHLDEWGYGSLRVNNKITKVHRFSYETFIGPIPEGLQLDHMCEVTNCVNPQHLQLVTNRENTGYAHGRYYEAGIWYCRNGHALTDYNALEWKGYIKCRTCHNETQRKRYSG